MCGIAGFMFRLPAPEAGLPVWLDDLVSRCDALAPGLEAHQPLARIVSALTAEFNNLMSCATCLAIVSDAAARARLEGFADRLDGHEAALVACSEAGHTEVDPVIEGLRDMVWQVREELIGSIDRIAALLPEGTDAPRAFASAYAVENVLGSIDRLEVRGRDSAGICIHAVIPADAATATLDALEAQERFAARSADVHSGDYAISVNRLEDGRAVLGFIYKTANLIGRLGENCAALRREISGDALFWTAAASAEQVNVLAHTRWASSGIISVANCHPHNASLTGDDADESELKWVAALNGDVDNHAELAGTLLRAKNRSVDPQITTDAKIIPVCCRVIEQDSAAPDSFDVFQKAIRRLDGSMAIAALNAAEPDEILIAQKGAGQGMHVAKVAEGWFFASEGYGLVSLTRETFDLANQSHGGLSARIQSGSDGLELRTLGDRAEVTLTPEAMQIFARDIYRGDFSTFLEKEIHDAPASVAKTLRGRFRMEDGRASFDGLPSDIWANLRDCLKGGLERIYVIGQGTAGVAADGIAHFVERALRQGLRGSVEVRSLRSSEMSAEIDRLNMRNALVIAVSQSGTTTDTNRAVDLAIRRGAFVHCIVNRRGSDLARKSHSVLYTSDGRDVEMSVASTKAFYTQLVAGKLTALFLADTKGTIIATELARELLDLQSLPEKIARLLEVSGEIQAAARTYAPQSRYWAVVGSGANHIPAREIRIKLSELCYKSIPADFTEDKKHIDLSTEPLTLVVATDLQPELLSDMVKEVAIFRAHNGKPIVFATEGGDAAAFAEQAQAVIPLPQIGSELGLVLAAVAGHLFGLFAAKAIDEGAQALREALNAFGRAAEAGETAALDEGLARLDAFVDAAAAGNYDSGLRGRDVAVMARWLARIRKAEDGAALLPDLLEDLRGVYEETSRPIDTIRHQAKTVTVGTSRPQDVISPAVRDALARAEVSEVQLKASDRNALATISRLTEMVPHHAIFQVEGTESELRLSFLRGNDASARADYGAPKRPVGVLGAASDTLKIALGRSGDGVSVVLPYYSDDQISVAGYVMLSTVPCETALTEHKVAVLKSLGGYQSLLRRWEEREIEDAENLLVQEIARARPMTVLTEQYRLLEAE